MSVTKAGLDMSSSSLNLKQMEDLDTLTILSTRQRILFEKKVSLVDVSDFTLVWVNDIVMDELKKIIHASDILKEDHKSWPKPSNVGRQELEMVIEGKHKSYTTSKLGSFGEV